MTLYVYCIIQSCVTSICQYWFTYHCDLSIYQPCNTIVITPPRELDWWRVVIIDRSYYRLGLFADWCSCTALKLGRCYNIMVVSDCNCESAQLMHVGNNRPALKITTPLIRTMAQILKNTLLWQYNTTI